ncbi:MAG: aspartyl/asparaginyl beta-hydroxylase domain-containing protein [Sphingomonas sp.]
MTPAAIQQALATAAEARRAGRNDVATRLYQQVLDTAGEQPMALNALGLQALAAGRLDDAAKMIRRAINADPASPELWINLARVAREGQDDDAEKEALEGALAIDQLYFMALVRMAELLDRMGSTAAAAEKWGGVVAMGSQIEERTPALENLLERARGRVMRQRANFAEAVDHGMAEARAAVDPLSRRRFDACIDHALGRRAIYANHCAGMHFPFLPAEEFFDRAHFPWLESIEAHADVIRAELQSVLAADAGLLKPYVAMPPGTPANKWSSLDHSPDWSAMHLWKDGSRDDAVCARFPLTASAMEGLPLSDLPGKTPTVFFSLLRPNAHLPAHTGVSNVRTIIHLPLIVPTGCSFRVGGETRNWEVGRAWAFDDTIEHEAWNRSDQVRAILIFDVWNPYIKAAERDLLRQFYAISDAIDGAPASAISISE